MIQVEDVFWCSEEISRLGDGVKQKKKNGIRRKIQSYRECTLLSVSADRQILLMLLQQEMDSRVWYTVQ